MLRPPPRPALALGAAVAALAALPGCVSLVDNAVADAISAPASEVRARDGAVPMADDPQTLMTRLTRPEPGDRERADRILAQAREALRPYRDPAAAEAAGYRPFPPDPGPDLPVVHYVNPGIDEERGVDYSRPGSILYERDAHGRLQLLGAMYTAPVSADLAELDRRVPLSVTQWHLHQNVCVPRPLWDEAQWARRLPGGEAAFGPGSPTATEAACDDLGGRFLPTVFGWMAHVNAFAEDPADVWDAHYGHDDHGRTDHGPMDHGGH